MLNNTQQLTIKVAVGKAADKDAEIKKLAKSFPAPEEEIRAYWNKISGAADKPNPAPAAGGPRGKRIVWTEDMLLQLTELRERGETYTRIAEMMGLDAKQVQNKYQRLPKQDKPPAAPMEKVPTSDSKSELDPKPFCVAKTAMELSSSDPQIPSGYLGSVDMPGALLLLIKLVHDQISEDVRLVYASNDEGCAACSFTVDGTGYDLTLGVSK